MALDTTNRWFAIDADQCGSYCLWDCRATALVHHALVDEMAKQGDPAYFANEVWPTMPAVLAMQRRGLPVDSARLRELANAYRDELAATDDEIRVLAGRPDANLNAPAQRADILFGVLGFVAPKRTATGRDSTDQDVLNTLHNKLGKRDDRRPVLEKLFHRSKVNTIVSRYLTMYPRGGRVFPTVKFCGTETERLAYSGPPLQQYPSQGRWLAIRSAFRASPGHVLVSADYSQLEARILAILSGDKVSLDAFARGEDIHVVNTLDLFGYAALTYAALAEQARKGARNYAKSFLYKISYGGAAELLKAKAFCPCPVCADDVPPVAHMGREDAAAAGARWFARHRPVLEFRRRLESDITARHYWESPLGGRRWLFSPWKEAAREAYNLPMQWIASQIVRRAMRRLHDAGAPMVLQMHDSLVLEVERSAADAATAMLRDAMTVPVAELGGAVFPVESSVGERWSDL